MRDQGTGVEMVEIYQSSDHSKRILDLVIICHGLAVACEPVMLPQSSALLACTIFEVVNVKKHLKTPNFQTSSFSTSYTYTKIQKMFVA
jgi:hypothetical protein